MAQQFELREFVRVVEEFCKKEIKPRVLELDSGKSFPWDIVRKGAEIGLLSLLIPEEYGGTARFENINTTDNILAFSEMMETLAWADAGVATIFGANALGISPLFFSFDKKCWDRFFPKIYEGSKQEKPFLCAFTITEPSAGSDVEDEVYSKYSNLTTKAKKEQDKYILSGRKTFISNGSVAKLITVFATTGEGVKDWTCFAVTPDMKGFFVESELDKMGQRACPTATLYFDNIQIPSENVIGKEGQGWFISQLCLDFSRLYVGSLSLGIARDAYERALKYASERKQGGKYLIEHQIIQHKIATMRTKIESAKGFIFYSANKIAQNPQSARMYSSMVKWFVSDLCFDVCNKAIQILGGYGYITDYAVEKCLRDVRVTQIYEGTNEIQKFRIIQEIQREMGIPCTDV